MDEVIHLASTLQMIGFLHVIPSMWQADDQAANSVARVFFQKLAAQITVAKEGSNLIASPEFAFALHEAIEAVRDGRACGGRRRKNASDNVTIWAPFIHIGY